MNSGTAVESIKNLATGEVIIIDGVHYWSMIGDNNRRHCDGDYVAIKPNHIPRARSRGVWFVFVPGDDNARYFPVIYVNSNSALDLYEFMSDKSKMIEVFWDNETFTDEPIYSQIATWEE